jgi:hypothetical protein
MFDFFTDPKVFILTTIIMTGIASILITYFKIEK